MTQKQGFWWRAKTFIWWLTAAFVWFVGILHPGVYKMMAQMLFDNKRDFREDRENVYDN